MCSLILGRHSDHTATKTSEHDMCELHNITIIPMYRTNDGLSYQVSRCNYCGKEWDEFWISYRYIFKPLISRYQHQIDSIHPAARNLIRQAKVYQTHFLPNLA
jgi:hypothetical protein